MGLRIESEIHSERVKLNLLMMWRG